jgi:hypothetical protein
MDWKAHLVSHFQSLFELVSKNIMHYHKKNKKRSSKAAADRLANEKDVQSMTTQLLTLFNDCDGGAGRHLKPLFSAAIAISYLYYYQKHYATKAARSFYPTLQQMLDPKKLASQLGCGYRTILNYLNELQNFILVCIRNTPGIAQHKKDIKLKNAYIFLDQVVKWIKPKDNNDRTAFPLQQETVPSYLRAQEESHRHEAAFERAKAGHIDDFERDSLEFNMRLLLDNGVEQNIVAGRSEVQIKQMCSVYYYRSMVNSTTIDDIPDLDQRELTQHDMSEAELAGYLR